MSKGGALRDVKKSKVTYQAVQGSSKLLDLLWILGLAQDPLQLIPLTLCVVLEKTIGLFIQIRIEFPA